jgi:hypothetical protein
MKDIVVDRKNVDGTPWPPGPWDAEPDRLQWQTEAGLPGLIVRSHLGNLCGDVGMSHGHPAHGLPYRAVEARFALSVHGGLTYAAACQEDGPICHVPAPGEPDDVWWLGCDGAHGYDLVPALAAWRLPVERPRSEEFETYRDLAFVRHEVESLAQQRAALCGSVRAPRRQG